MMIMMMMMMMMIMMIYLFYLTLTALFLFVIVLFISGFASCTGRPVIVIDSDSQCHPPMSRFWLLEMRSSCVCLYVTLGVGCWVLGVGTTNTILSNSERKKHMPAITNKQTNMHACS
jgi:hypothetical protein